MHVMRARRLAAIVWTLAALAGCGGSSQPPPPQCTLAADCAALPNATPACVNGACTLGACAAGYADCDASAASGCEVGTATSLAHCGACNQACAPANASGACVAGQCQIVSCSGGFSDCDGSAANGCEVNTATSLAHCGACNQACAPANASGACNAGQCAVVSCTPPFSDCDGDPSNGCECVLQSSHPGITVFNQTVAAQDGDGVAFPGQANFWDLDGDFSLRGGGDRQFAGALVLKVGALEATAEYFPGDQTYSELSFYVPEFTAADGVRTAAVSGPFTAVGGQGRTCATEPNGDWCRRPISGSHSAWLASTSDSRLSQVVDLTGVTPGTTVTLSWQDAGFGSAAAVLPGEGFSYRVMARPARGSNVMVEPPVTGAWPTTARTTDLSALAGQRVTLSFEFRGPQVAMMAVDDVSVTAGAGGPNLVQNGGFETGDLTGWATNAPAEPQNVASGARTLGGLRVTRTVYAPPSALWARWLDVYENAGAADVVTTAWYETALGSAGNGVTYLVDRAQGMALSSWDTCSAAAGCAPGTRDVGLAFGAASGVTFATAPDLSGNNWALSDLVTWHHPLLVPAGGRVALVHFVVMDGADTGTRATSVANRALAADSQSLAIVAGFWSDLQYRAGMAQAQIDAVANWPRECVRASDCPAIANGTPACVSGACVVGACSTDFADCNGFRGDGCEVTLATDPLHCGTCATACPAVIHGTPGCAAGACGVGSCAAGFGDCDALPGNGCEADLSSDLAHCGACAAACAPAHATGACTVGTCGIASCDPGFADCRNGAADGCEVDLATDVDNCGTCYLACSVPNGTPACVGSRCEVATCDAPFADCNGSAGDGCEINTSGDLAHCGACGAACAYANATAACVDGTCDFAGCLPWYASCNSSLADGCEIYTATDVQHCGTCATACAAPPNAIAGCSGGVCGIGACNAGFADCANGAADGCETSTSADPLNCGGCGVACAGGSCVGGACAPVIVSVSPAFGSVEGGEVVVVSGFDFTGATSVVVGGTTVPAAVGGGGTSLAFTSPAHASGVADVSITNGAGRTATATGAFEYLLALAPGRTLTVDGQSGDWTSDYLVAPETTTTDWAGNALRALSVAYTPTHLYLGIDGETALATGNALVAYLDRDAGVGTGVGYLGTLTDNTGSLDDACSGVLDASGVAGFGAEFCLGTVDMTSVSVGSPASTDKAGLREVATNLGDFAWALDGLGGSLVAVAAPGGTGAWVEMAVPWTSIYGAGGLPAAGASLSLFVRVANSTGGLHANQSLPSQGGAAVETVTAVFTFRAR